MKKIIIFILSIVLFFSFFPVFSACNYDWEIWQWLNDCLEWSSLVDGRFATVWNWLWFNTKIISWVKTIGSILSLIAVGWIVYGSFELVISSGADETVSKWKNIIKRSILWFVALLSAGSIIAIVVNIMYALG